MLQKWKKIIFYRRIYWLIFICFIPFVLAVNAIFKNQILINSLIISYVACIALFLKIKLLKKNVQYAIMIFSQLGVTYFLLNAANVTLK